MCGITAIITLDKIPSKDLDKKYRDRITKEVAESVEKLKHRGPDSQNFWVSDDNRVALGFSRLAINDLSIGGNQPFHDASDCIHAIVNGEIYMTDGELKELEGWHDFKGHSDCEVVIPLYLKYGEQFLSKLRGEFSLVLFDARRQHVIMARDRYGIKPLFWTICENRLLISSEAKGFLPLGWKPEWDVKSLMDDGWRYGERSLFKGVFKPRPANYIVCISFDYLETREYWDLEYPDKSIKDTRTEDEIIQQLREIFRESVRRRLKADVPVGIYLSGGLDSSAVAGMAVSIVKEECEKSGRSLEEAKKLLKCFSVGFDKGTVYDESEIARRTAEYLGLEYEVIRINDELNAQGFVDATYYSEHHMQDLGYLGKFWLSDLAEKSGYKTILTGEGSDEHFGGYTMFYPDAMREPDGQWPGPELDNDKRKEIVWNAEEDARRLLKRTGLDRLKLTTQDDLSGCGMGTDEDTRGQWRRNLNNISLPTHSIPMTIADFAPWTEKIYGSWDPRITAARCPGVRNLDQINKKWHPFNTSAYVWVKSVLANTLLTVYGDRTEMAHSVEGRPPFLDHHLTEFANTIPTSLKIKYDNETGEFSEKWILKQAMKPYITEEIYNRKKFIFMSPSIIKPGGSFHKLLLELVTEENIDQLGFLDWGVTEARLKQALEAGEPFSQRYIYTVAQWVVLSQKFGVSKAMPF